MPAARELVGGRQARRTGADDQHALAGRRGLAASFQPLPDRLVAEEALDGVDADGLVELRAVAGGLARVVADAPHHGGQRVVLRRARARPPRSRRTRRGTATAGCSRRPGRRGCRAAGGARRPGAPARQEPVLLARLEPTSSVIANGLSISRACTRALRSSLQQPEAADVAVGAGLDAGDHVAARLRL